MTERILIFATSYLPLMGGAQLAVHEITGRNPNFEFHLYTAKLSRKLTRRETIGNVTVHRVGIGISLDKFLLPLLAPAAALLRHGFGVPVIWGMMAQYGGMAALVYHLLTFRRNRFLLTLQEGGEFREMEKKAGLLLPIMKLVVGNCTTLQVISHALLGWARELGYRGTDYHVIPNGVDFKRFAQETTDTELTGLRSEIGVSSDSRIVFSASRLSPKNGMPDLVTATSLLPPSYVTVIAGEGKQRGLIERSIQAHNLRARVVMLGDIPSEKVVRLLHIAHVFVRPSLSEGLGNAFLEAMAAGIPVVGTPVGGITDFLEDRTTGLYAQPRNPQSIADCIMAYEDDILYDSIRSNGIEMVQNRFDWNLIATDMRPLLENRGGHHG